MTITLPYTIHRSIIGLLVILVVGSAVEALLYVGIISLEAQGASQATLGLIYIVAIIVFAVTAVAAIMYDSASIVMTTVGITYTNYLKPWSPVDNYTQWNKIQDVKTVQPTFLQSVFGCGTLKIHSAGDQDDESDFTLTWVYDVDVFRDFIEQQMETTSPNA